MILLTMPAAVHGAPSQDVDTTVLDIKFIAEAAAAEAAGCALVDKAHMIVCLASAQLHPRCLRMQACMHA